MYQRIETDSESISRIPNRPGIYRFINDNEEILYIGASGNLQKRVSQYFRKASDQNRKLTTIRKNTRFIEFLKHKDVRSAFEAERIEIWTNHPTLNVIGNSVHSFSYLIVRKVAPLAQECQQVARILRGWGISKRWLRRTCE